MERPKKTKDCTLIPLLILFSSEDFLWIPNLTDSIFISFVLNSASRSDEWFSFLFGYSKDRFLLGRPVLPPMNTRRRHRDTGHFSI
ncbi:hypothetical protein V8C37DRAFT_395981 [Trichoderma ceciliae]